METQEIANPTLKNVEANGAKLSYIEKGSGEPVVFVHGAVSDFRTWLEQFNALANDYRVISYSRRGHYPNDAETDDSEYTRDAHAADLIEFLKTLKLEKTHLIGHSYGAAVALLAAVRQPALVGSLVLAEPGPFPALLDEDADWLLAAQRAGFERVMRLAQNGEQEAAVREFLHTVIGIDAYCLLPAERRAVVLENAGTLLPMLRRYYDSALTAEQLKNLKVPALFITGEISPVIARLTCKTIDRYLPNSKIAVLKCASHGLQMENPEGFSQLAVDFLAVNRKTAPLDEKSLLYSPIFNRKLG
jgi:pimeloyl-ACP methyl ester carboxylesterase